MKRRITIAAKKPPAERTRQTRWDKRNLRTVSTHLTKKQAALLKMICYTNHTTPYHLLRTASLDYIKRYLHHLELAGVPVPPTPEVSPEGAPDGPVPGHQPRKR